MLILHFRDDHYASVDDEKALTEALCKSMCDRYSIAIVTNDIYTQEDAEFLTRTKALPAE